MAHYSQKDDGVDHCRIGSLEKKVLELGTKGSDHCRIGSLEIPRSEEDDRVSDHCRIGSLEIQCPRCGFRAT